MDYRKRICYNVLVVMFCDILDQIIAEGVVFDVCKGESGENSLEAEEEVEVILFDFIFHENENDLFKIHIFNECFFGA